MYLSCYDFLIVWLLQFSLNRDMQVTCLGLVIAIFCKDICTWRIYVFEQNRSNITNQRSRVKTELFCLKVSPRYTQLSCWLLLFPKTYAHIFELYFIIISLKYIYIYVRFKLRWLWLMNMWFINQSHLDRCFYFLKLIPWRIFMRGCHILCYQILIETFNELIINSLINILNYVLLHISPTRNFSIVK